jgi:site-specific recombinase XerD
MIDDSALFCGPMAAALVAFVTLMRTTGSSHVSLVSTLRRLDRHLKEKHPVATALTHEIVVGWYATFDHLRPASQRRYRSATSRFCAFLRARDPATVPEHAVPALRRPRDFIPCVLTEVQIVDLLHRARTIHASKRNPLRSESMYLTLVLLYTAGLRLGEVVRLDISDFDPAAGTLLIRETKFAKTRLVPLSASTQRIVDAYLRERRAHGIGADAAASLIWSLGRRRLCFGTIEGAIRRLFRESGLKPEKGRAGPRPHDLRHTFAAHRMLAWYRAGADLGPLLPRLSTYLGHRDLASTQHYLGVLPGVMEHASHRFEARRAPWGARP